MPGHTSLAMDPRIVESVLLDEIEKHLVGGSINDHGAWSAITDVMREYDPSLSIDIVKKMFWDMRRAYVEATVNDGPNAYCHADHMRTIMTSFSNRTLGSQHSIDRLSTRYANNVAALRLDDETAPDTRVQRSPEIHAALLALVLFEVKKNTGAPPDLWSRVAGELSENGTDYSAADARWVFCELVREYGRCIRNKPCDFPHFKDMHCIMQNFPRDTLASIMRTRKRPRESDDEDEPARSRSRPLDSPDRSVSPTEQCLAHPPTNVPFGPADRPTNVSFSPAEPPVPTDPPEPFAHSPARPVFDVVPAGDYEMRMRAITASLELYKSNLELVRQAAKGCTDTISEIFDTVAGR